MTASIDVNDLTPDQRKDLGLTKRREQTFTKEDVRTHSLAVLNLIRHLTRGERARVLKHAEKLNSI